MRVSDLFSVPCFVFRVIIRAGTVCVVKQGDGESLLDQIIISDSYVCWILRTPLK